MGVIVLIGILELRAATTDDAGNLKSAIAAVRAVGPNGKGSADAAKAWQVLAKAEIGRLPDLLAAMDGANALACNWIRSAMDEVLARAKNDKQSLPLAPMVAFVRDPGHNPNARRFAYELLVEADPAAKERFLPDMMDDPSPELRRDAVARVIEQGERIFATEKKADALPLFQKSLASAREKDQIDKTIKRLRELGQSVDLPKQLGFIQDWHVIGPFPNEKDQGVNAVYPPEKGIDLSAEYDGKSGKVKWQPYVTHHDFGMVDLNTGVGKHLNAVAYALAEFTSAEAQRVDIRIGCYTVFKLWVNGELVLERGDAYTGMSFDNYIAQAKLKPGKNTILMKVCQAEPPAQLPKLWQFQLRIADATGKAILSTSRPAIPPMEKPKDQ
jgi:hypothetical protein